MTNIEWVKNPDGTQGITWNPITGCLNHVNGLCKGGGFPCYAYKLANIRLKQRYLANTNRTPLDLDILEHPENASNRASDPFYPRFWEERLYHPWGGKPRGIFPCDMGDLFGIGIPREWTRTVLDLCRKHEQNRYYLLTKQPQRLPEFSPFSENCWVGVTVCNADMYLPAMEGLDSITAKVKYVSFEPLLENPSEFCEQWSEDLNATIDWLIIGACTGNLQEMTSLAEKYPDLWLAGYGNKWTLQPKIEWLQEIVEAANKAGVKVFLKDNLKPLFKPDYEVRYPWAYDWGTYRQEMPE